MAASREDLVDRFHRLFYDAAASGGTWYDTYWLGVLTHKCPLDLWVYQEILFERRPDVVLETGTAAGGSALFLASVFDALGAGRVVTVDILEQPRPDHRRIEYITGSSADPAIADRLRASVSDSERVMVVLDSDHSQQHVAAELALYADLVSPGQYLVVEDTNVNGNPVFAEHGPGPMEAVREFLAQRADFRPDPRREKFLLTFNPGGYLLREGG